jgi:nudix-type nucleoside diphosphatase (YffH/AdpP family)
VLALEVAMSESRKAVIHKTTRLFNDFFQVDEVMVSHQRADGTMSPDERRLIFERGDAVAIMLYNPDSKSVIIVNQFKVSSLVARRRDDPNIVDGWVTEATAGMIDKGETPEKAIIRETLEETGYRIVSPRLISKFFSSPGGTSERIFLYFAEVRDSDKVGGGGGLPNEDVTVMRMPAHELFDQLDKGSIEDPKLAIGAYWLKDYLNAGHYEANPGTVEAVVHGVFSRLTKSAESWFDDYLQRREQNKSSSQAAAASASPPPPSTPQAARAFPSGPLPYSTVCYELKNKPGLIVGYKTGRIDNIRGASIWVNSENTDMLMDRIIGRSVSSRIRLLGSNTDEDGNIIEDTIAEALRAAVGPRGHVRIGAVLVTESGSLKQRGVDRILHVATVQAETSQGGGVRANLNTLASCVTSVLDRAEKINKRYWSIVKNLARESFRLKPHYDESILIPTMGAGEGGLSVEEVAQAIIPAAIEHMTNVPLPTLKKVFFIAFDAKAKAACDAVLEKAASEHKLVKKKCE